MDALAVSGVPWLRELFGGAEHLALIVEAMIAGNSPAKAWVDDAANPRAALLWDGAHNVYIAGSAQATAPFRDVVGSRIAPAQPGLVKVYGADAAARSVFAGHALAPRERVLYRHDLAPAPGWHNRLPAGLRVSAIREELDQLSGLRNFADVAAEIESCWQSMADFVRAGFGFCACDGASIVGWCTAEYVSDGRCGIGIETVAAYQGQGIATLTASAFTGYCATRSITPHWDAWSSNLPSVAVAEKVGFRKVETYSVLVADLRCRHLM